MRAMRFVTGRYNSNPRADLLNLRLHFETAELSAAIVSSSRCLLLFDRFSAPFTGLFCGQVCSSVRLGRAITCASPAAVCIQIEMIFKTSPKYVSPRSMWTLVWLVFPNCRWPVPTITLKICFHTPHNRVLSLKPSCSCPQSDLFSLFFGGGEDKRNM